MMPQRESSESLFENENIMYGGYEGNRTHDSQHAEPPYEQPQGAARTAEKVYPIPQNNSNMLRMAIFVIAMVTLLIFALFCLFLLPGTQGWICFIVAAGVIFLISVVTVDKIK